MPAPRHTRTGERRLRRRARPILRRAPARPACRLRRPTLSAVSLAASTYSLFLAVAMPLVSTSACPVLPRYTRSHTLPLASLADIKRAVRRNLADAGLGFGIFDEEGEAGVAPTALSLAHVHDHGHPLIHRSPASAGAAGRPADVPGATPPAHGSASPPQQVSADAQPRSPAAPPAAPVPATETVPLLPFALFAPECYTAQHKLGRRELVGIYAAAASEFRADSADGDSERPGAVEEKRGDAESRLESLKGRFVRRYRWGVLDALDARHSDFSALRRAVMGWRKVPCLAKGSCSDTDTHGAGSQDIHAHVSL